MKRLFAGALLCAVPLCGIHAAQVGYNTLISHKGESLDAPENTLPAYKTAVERGFGFECDVYLSKDGRVFTFHDKDFSRMTNGANTNKCADVTWAEISKLDVGGWGKWKGSKFSPTRPALLEEVLQLARDGRYIYVEIKPGPEIVPYIKKVVEAQNKATPRNMLFISFDEAACKALKAQMPEYKVFWITSSKHWNVAGYPPVTAKDVIKVMRETGADGVDCHFDPTVVTKEMVAEVRKAGYEFHVWTVDKLEDTEEAFRRGVQTVTTNCAQAQLKAAEAKRAASRSFTFATWNIAHYSCGKTYPSTIPAAEMPKYKAAYEAFLDKADASVIGICEDSWFCDAASTLTARETIFSRYTGFASEKARPFDYNSLYWKGAECLDSGRRMFRKTTEPRFYRWARLRIGGREVVVVEAHLEWNITLPGHMDDRKDEIRQIIEDFKDEPRVVIGGDFNTSLMLSDGKTEINTPEDYEAFRAAGYAAAHWGTINTWPSGKPLLSIDNIFAKGLWIDDVEVFGDAVLSDHCLMRCRLTFDEPGEPVAAAPARYTDGVADAPRMRGVMSPARDMTEDDFKTLKSWGATLLRYQIIRDWHGVNANRDIVEYDGWMRSRLDHIDKVVLPLAVKYGLKVMIDVHVPPGGRTAASEHNMFYEERYARYFVDMWRRIARRFKGREGIYGYDLINEPCHKRMAAPGFDCWSLQRKAAEAVRAEDPKTPIIATSNEWGGPDGFAALKPLPVENVIYQVHMYEPFEFTHQRVLGTRPWTVRWPNPEKGWDRSYLKNVLAPVRAFQKKYGAKIYVGEFSAICWAPGAGVYLRDCIDIFEEYGWDWTYHAFREWPGWSVEHEGEDAESLRPSKDNPRRRALVDGLGRKRR